MTLIYTEILLSKTPTVKPLISTFDIPPDTMEIQ